MSAHTPTPWKVVSLPHFDSGLVYTSIQPVNVDEEAMKPLAMVNGEYHICRMSHTAAEWRFIYHRANAEFIVTAVNSHASLLARIAELEEALEPFALISSEGVVRPTTTGYATVTTQAEYFHRAAAVMRKEQSNA